MFAIPGQVHCPGHVLRPSAPWDPDDYQDFIAVYGLDYALQPKLTVTPVHDQRYTDRELEHLIVKRRTYLPGALRRE